MSRFIGYFKSDATDFVLVYSGGRTRRAGAGLAERKAILAAKG